MPVGPLARAPRSRRPDRRAPPPARRPRPSARRAVGVSVRRSTKAASQPSVLAPARRRRAFAARIASPRERISARHGLQRAVLRCGARRAPGARDGCARLPAEAPHVVRGDPSPNVKPRLTAAAALEVWASFRNSSQGSPAADALDRAVDAGGVREGALHAAAARARLRPSWAAAADPRRGSRACSSSTGRPAAAPAWIARARTAPRAASNRTSVGASPSPRSPSMHAQVARGVAGEQRLGGVVGVVARDVRPPPRAPCRARARPRARAARASAPPGARRAGCLRRGRRGTRAPRAARAAAGAPSRSAIHAGRRARSTGQTSTTTPALAERAEPGARTGSLRSRRGSETRSSMSGLGRSQYCAIASPPCAPGLPLGRRSSTIFLPPKSDRLARGVRELAPVEAAARLEHLALGEAARARRGAHRVRRLEREQRLVAVDHVDRAASVAPEVRRRAARRAAARYWALGWSCAAASRRMICCTMSLCMSR